MPKVLPTVSNVRRPAAINSLTSLRFIAALLVFIWHAPLPFEFNPHSLELGYVGVGFFYILSGFILTYVYYQKVVSRKKGSIKKFYISRIAKIYPVHLLTFLASIPLVILTAQTIFGDHLKFKLLVTAFFNLTLMQAWIPKTNVNFSYNAVAWSISVEAFFYLLFPLIILVVYKFRTFFTLRNTVLVMVGLWLVCVAIYAPQITHVDDWKLYVFPLVRLPDFLVGIMLALIYEKSNKKKLFGVRISKRAATAVEIAAVAAVVLGILLSQVMPQSLRFALWLMPSLAFVVFVFSYQKGRLSELLNNKILIFLGEASFSFYMVHQLIIRYILQLPISSWGAVVLSFVLATTVSGFLYAAYEEPIRLRLKVLLEKKFATR